METGQFEDSPELRRWIRRDQPIINGGVEHGSKHGLDVPLFRADIDFFRKERLIRPRVRSPTRSFDCSIRLRADPRILF